MNESIQSVRYFGDRAYVVTYRQIDPLFAIDLSDQTNPQAVGS
ncbi:MAG: beta-propeller domain-containing protein [Pirellulaceae bacterium]